MYLRQCYFPYDYMYSFNMGCLCNSPYDYISSEGAKLLQTYFSIYLANRYAVAFINYCKRHTLITHMVKSNLITLKKELNLLDYIF